MNSSRKNKILELIEEYELETQQQLVELLAEAGFKATQATVSRDIRDLELIKSGKDKGKSCYVLPPKPEKKINDRFVKILRETVRDIRSAENIIVIHTLSGCANAAAEALDSYTTDEVLGTIAGDNTIFLVVDSRDHVERITARIKEIVS